MNKAHFKSVIDLCDTILEINDLNEDNEYFEGVSVVGHYEVISEVLNYLVKNTNLEMYDINLCPSEINGYYDEYILSVDQDGDIWCQEAKYEDRYFQTEKEIIFVHSDVNSKFAVTNKGQEMIEFEYIDECDGNCENCPLADLEDEKLDNEDFLDIDDNLHGFTLSTSKDDTYKYVSFYTTDKIDDISIVKELIKLFAM